MTPLHHAAKKGLLKVVERMIADGADVNAIGPSNRTALHYAAESGHMEIVKILLSKPNKVLLKSGFFKRGSTAEDLARKAGHTEIASLLEKIRLEMLSAAMTHEGWINYQWPWFKRNLDAIFDLNHLMDKNPIIEEVLGTEEMKEIVDSEAFSQEDINEAIRIAKRCLAKSESSNRK